LTGPRFAALVAAQTLFLWMFFAADGLEQLATAGAFAGDATLRDRAFAFAAEWRHGMAGNSPLYMPGFFAVAAATWLFVEKAPGNLPRALAVGLIAASVVAAAAAPFGSVRVVSSFTGQHGLPGDLAAEVVSSRAIATGLYTLVTWTVFVLGSRAALVRRTLLPLLPVPLLAAVLAAVRPWTVDEFTAVWWWRIGEADPFALGSAAAVPLLAYRLARRTSRRRAKGGAAAHLGGAVAHDASLTSSRPPAGSA
jgi:hypothetical protein